MNHCSIPVRRSSYLLFGSFLFGQCSIIFFFQCSMIFSFQTVSSSKSVNNYMLVDADMFTSLNYWCSSWKCYSEIRQRYYANILQRLACDSTNHESGFVLFIPLLSNMLRTRTTKTSKDQCWFLGGILIEVMDPGLASERGYDTR